MNYIIKCANKAQWDEIAKPYWLHMSEWNDHRLLFLIAGELTYAPIEWYYNNEAEFANCTYVCYNEYKRLEGKA